MSPSVLVREGVVAAGVGRRAWSPDLCDGSSWCGVRGTEDGRATAGVSTGHQGEQPLSRSPRAGREARGGAEFAFRDACDMSEFGLPREAWVRSGVREGDLGQDGMAVEATGLGEATYE